MKSMKVRVNSGTDHYDRDLGPPLPRSLVLWGYWGCHYCDNEDCIATENPVTGKVTHEHVIEFWMDHCFGVFGCQNSPTCPYFIHYLVGDREEPGDYDD